MFLCWALISELLNCQGRNKARYPLLPREQLWELEDKQLALGGEDRGHWRYPSEIVMPGVLDSTLKERLSGDQCVFWSEGEYMGPQNGMGMPNGNGQSEGHSCFTYLQILGVYLLYSGPF